MKNLFIFFVFCSLFSCNNTSKPNVILVVVDDQGYGDIAAHGNKVIETPNIDQLHNESTRLTNFHVSPTCAPTRASIMTGRYANRVGVWHTVMGRSLLREKETTIADIFKQNGYSTAIYGKWHLGDNYPFSPQYRGFQESLTHGGGGVGQTPDYWNNDYLDDVYLRNGKEELVQGYCTDVWFKEALSFIEINKEKPFFCYISTNAPHSPLNVPEEYVKPYLAKGEPSNRAKFYGMISNVDENLGTLREKLNELQIEDNTILIFMTDNGTAYGASFKNGQLKSGYNAEMKGTKGSPYEGGHRVPFFIHWKQGKLSKPQTINTLSAHIDILPTLINLCGLNSPNAIDFDGKDLTPVFYGDSSLGDRILIGDSQRLEYPEKWRNSYTMKGSWRLINGKELYNVKSDPSQQINVANNNPEIVKELKRAYELNWISQEASFNEFPYIKLGSSYEPNSVLTAHDWHASEEKMIPWNQKLVRKGIAGNGEWRVHFLKSGKYKISLRRYPKESGLGINSVSPKLNSKFKNYILPKGKAFSSKSAILKIGSKSWTKPISENDKEVVFEVDINEGETVLSATLMSDNTTQGAYYAYVNKI